MTNPPQLTAKSLVWGYCHGYFPMQDPKSGQIEWYSADPRGIIHLHSFHCPKSLARRYRSGRFAFTTNLCFTRVMQECAQAPRSTPGAWIAPEMIRAYTQLHKHDMAHSIEAWLPADTTHSIRDRDTAHIQPLGESKTPHILVGGLYGVHLGSIFFGESMFHRATDASRVSLVHLVAHLKSQNFSLLEIQAVNEHTFQFGSQSIPGEQYLELLEAGLNTQAKWQS